MELSTTRCLILKHNNKYQAFSFDKNIFTGGIDLFSLSVLLLFVLLRVQFIGFGVWGLGSMGLGPASEEISRKPLYRPISGGVILTL